jgi:phosphopantothenoylcysteine decarboxylase
MAMMQDPQSLSQTARLLAFACIVLTLLLLSLAFYAFLGYMDLTTARSQLHNTNSKTTHQSLSSKQSLGLGPPLRAADHINDNKFHLLLAATGSVATIKIPNIVSSLSKHPNLSIRIILTDSATSFLQSQSQEQPSLAQIAKSPVVEGIYTDADEWIIPWMRGASIPHIELRRWADMMVIAPLSANSLAKIALGMSDNLVTSVVRAWDTTGIIDLARPGIGLPYGGGKRKGIVVAPAMNTAMWHHPVTAEHVRRLEDEWGVGEDGEGKGRGWFEVLRPIEKELACGDTGSGAMHDWKGIVETIEGRLGLDESEREKVG